MPSAFERHVVLVCPEIHWNTGNIGRSCLGAGAAGLHLIEPLGFSVDDRHIKRAGLDYWHRVPLSVWPDFAAFRTEMAVADDEAALFTKSGTRPFWEMPAKNRLFLIFGSESRGLPENIVNLYDSTAAFYIPITEHVRSLNLSSAATVALYESLRPVGASFHAWSG